MPEQDLIAYRLEELSKKLDDFDRRLTLRFAAEDSTKLDQALRIDRLEQRLALSSKIVGAIALALLGLIVNATSSLFQ